MTQTTLGKTREREGTMRGTTQGGGVTTENDSWNHEGGDMD